VRQIPTLSAALVLQNICAVGLLTHRARGAATNSETERPRRVRSKSRLGDRPAAQSCVVVLAALLAGSAALAEEAAKPAAASQAVTISVALEQPDAAARAGEPLALRITLTNTTAKPLVVPDWDHFADELSIRVSITGYPGERGKQEEAAATWEGGPFQRGDFRELPPGKTVIARPVVPMLPGKARIAVGFHGPTDTYRALTDGKPVRQANAWVGHVYTSLEVNVPQEISPEMKKRYDEVRERLSDPLVPADQRGRLLVIVAEEKNYFAARFVAEQCLSLPAGPMRDAALWQLLKLAKVGTAYAWIDVLLGKMTDPNVEQSIREAILDWAADSLIQKGRLAIADQAAYEWPDNLLKQAHAEVKRVTEDRNPYLAAKAKELLKRVDEAAAK